MHPRIRPAHISAQLSLLLFAVAIVGLSTCGPKNPIGGREGGLASTNSNSNSASTTYPSPWDTTTSSAGQKIGVPECDEFIAAYDACVSGKVPETARAQYKTAIAQWRSSWSKLAANPQTKASLVTACKQAAETARTSMKTYGCTF
jgi:hypothetical protein